MTTETELLNIHVECAPAKNVTITSTSNTTSGGNFTVYGVLSPTCNTTFTGPLINPTAWFGQAGVAVPSCITAINSSAPTVPTNLPQDKWPVAFAFASNGTNASVAFCFGYQKVFNATVFFDFGANRVYTPSSNFVYVPDQDIEGYPITGYGFDLLLV